MLTVHQWQLVCLVILFYYRWWKKFCSPILYRVWYISGGVGFQLSWDVAAMAWDAKSFAGWNRHHQDDTTSCVPFSRGAPKTNVQFLRLHTVFWASGIPNIKQETPLAWNHEPITALANTWQSQKKMWSALYLASYILPRRCFFQNFNSIQIFGDFPQNATNPSSSIFAMNNSPACIFISSCTIQHKIFAKRITNLHLVQLNEALPFGTRPLLQQLLEYQNRPSMGDAGILPWTLPTGFTVDSCEGFFLGGFPSKKGMDYSGPLPTRVLDPPKDIHIFFPKPVHFRWFPDSSLEFDWYLKF